MFLTMLGLQYFNQGTKMLNGLAFRDIMKSDYHMEPGDLQKLSSFLMLPWAIKIFYGMMSDNIPILGSKKKSYLLIMGIVQTVVTAVMASLDTKDRDFGIMLMSWCTFFSSMSTAFSDVIVDSLMII